MNEPNQETQNKNANELLAAGTTLGLVGAAGTLLTGAVCPLCIIGTPVLLGMGLFKKLRFGRRRSSSTSFRLPLGWSRINKLKERPSKP